MNQREKNSVSKKQAGIYAKTVLERQLSCTVTSIRFIGGGSFGFVYEAAIDKAPGTVVMKGFRTAGMCEREASELRLLAHNSAVKVPQVYFTFAETPELPMDFLCMEKVGGTNCFTDFGKLLQPKKKKEAFADAVTSAARRWHEQTNDKFGLIGNAVYDGWFDFYRPFAEEILEEARRMRRAGRLGKRALAAMERGMERFDDIFREPVEKACLIHGDLNVMNIMADKKLNVTAVIDPLESKWADPEYELFQMRNLTGNLFGLYETYKRKYPVSINCDVKTAFYALYHEVYTYIVTGSRIHWYLPQMVRRFERELRRAGL
ncbi:MAG: aminoglycoside phosphotransferase family protein [Clostridia bacterium]|nr:aminoglycoside phosphotransferase family protein [Clostridia bacterium]